MSNERIDLTQFEGLTTPWDFGKKYPHIESAKVAVELIAELKDLRWKHMQLLRERKDLRDEGLRLARKVDSQDGRIKSLLNALRIIRDDIDEAMDVGSYPYINKNTAVKIRNFANDASQ